MFRATMSSHEVGHCVMQFDVKLGSVLSRASICLTPSFLSLSSALVAELEAKKRIFRSFDFYGGGETAREKANRGCCFTEKNIILITIDFIEQERGILVTVIFEPSIISNVSVFLKLRG